MTDIFSLRNQSLRKHTVGTVSFNMINLHGNHHFSMGNNNGEEESYKDEQPRHHRKVAPFSLAEHPVTQALWAEVNELAKKRRLKFNERLLRSSPSYFPGLNRPVEDVSWDAAKEFCRVLNLLCGKKDKFFRLPSEVEWEYAARAGDRKTLYAGTNNLADVGWFDGNNEKETMPVGLLSPNAFGVFDLSGNILEWCEDDWHNNYENHPIDGQAWINNLENRASVRVLRGGSWLSNARLCRCAYRVSRRTVIRSRGNGFRLAAPVQV